jgi:predicted alpha/beta hydrolase family esterase
VHIIGTSDQIVAPESSKKLAGKFENPLALEHEGGHVVACTPEIEKQLLQFLQNFVSKGAL